MRSPHLPAAGPNLARTVRLAVLVVVLTLAAAACDGSVPDPDSTTSDRPTAADRDPSAEASAASTPGDAPSESPWSSPLNDFLGAGQEFDHAEVERQQDEYNDIMVACMAAEGFEYILPNEDDVSHPTAWDLARDDFVASYGYGITTIDRELLPVFEDPNQAQLDEMSPAERTAFHRALHGEVLPLGEDGFPDMGAIELEAPVSQDRGCSGRASDEVYGSTASSDDAFEQFRGLLDDMAALEDRVAHDPRVVDATRAWSGCMASAGQPFDTPADAREAVQERVLAAQGGTGDGLTAGDDGLASREVLLRPGGLDELDPQRLEELRSYELTISGVDHDCAVEHDLRQVERDVRHELEEAFIQEHRAELEAYRDLVASSGGVG